MIYTVAFIALIIPGALIRNGLCYQNYQFVTILGVVTGNIIECQLHGCSWCQLQLDEILAFDKTEMIN